MNAASIARFLQQGPSSASPCISRSLWPIGSRIHTGSQIVRRQVHSSSSAATITNTTNNVPSSPNNSIRLSRLISQHSVNLAVSRREAERLILGGDVRLAGQLVTAPHYLVPWNLLTSSGVVQVAGKPLALRLPSSSSGEITDNHLEHSKQRKTVESFSNTKVWLVHKLKGEVVAEDDPQGRPSLLQRLVRGGVGRKHQQRHHLKPVGRLDITTEGLLLVTNNGKYARDMELPKHRLHRTYRVRVHGALSQYKMRALQRGMTVTDPHSGQTVRYAPMKAELDEPGKRSSRKRSSGNLHATSTNTWMRITCTEGKNRQVRNVLQYLGLTVTRLIRVSFGDYQLQTIPPGMALEVPVRPIEGQKHRGALFLAPRKRRQQKQQRQLEKQQPPSNEEAPPVQWVRHFR